jgi:hypothetical protein
MAGGQNPNGGVKWTAMSTILAALIAATATITIGYWQYFQKKRGDKGVSRTYHKCKNWKSVATSQDCLGSSGFSANIYGSASSWY